MHKITIKKKIVFCHFSYNVFFDIALPLIDVHYFDAESSKNSIVTNKMHKITYFFKKQMAAILYLSFTKIE